MSQQDYLKYSPIFLENLKRTGSIYSAAKLSNTNILVIQTWKHYYPEFTEQINEAIEYHQNNRTEILRNEAERVLMDYVLGLAVETTITETTVRDQSGEIISTIESKREKITPPPVKLLQQILFDLPSEEGRAVTTLARSGILPKTLSKRLLTVLEKNHQETLDIFSGHYPDEEGETLPGISEKTEASISAKFLGLSENKTLEAVAETVEDDA
jgi:hypothetical protein